MSKLFRACEKYRLWLVPPYREGGLWNARTGYGANEETQMGGVGATPEEAIKDALTNKDEERDKKR